ncbi:MAG: formate C-acetyltransferase [Bacilli bacterium]|nr:formate C-acetyltransferase [Bacilli bacterium]
MNNTSWQDFKQGVWSNIIDVEDFILQNYSFYAGDSSFLCGISPKTKAVLDKLNILTKEELSLKGPAIDFTNISGIDNFEPGYIDKNNEIIVGLQTNTPLKRIINPYGGIKMVEKIFKTYNYTLDPNIINIFSKYAKTHNQGVYDAYTKEIRTARKAGLITGLPDCYGRGRIIGDYRRVSLYGVDYLISKKEEDFSNLLPINEENIRLREEVSDQIKALVELKSMALKYGFDISMPAKNSKEAIQWLYFSYLAAVKENNGAAMSLGRTSTFIDIYIERDLKNNFITEIEAQELIDQFIIKLRMVRHLRTPEYDELFAGDPNWITESIGGITNDGRSLITKTSFRYLNTLNNLNPAPEPNLTILWSENLPISFKKYCTEMSIKTDAIQYENDDLMRPLYGDDYAIACCVSAMKLGKQMQYFGARCNLAKVLLYAINGGIDELSGLKVLEGFEILKDDVLDYNKVIDLYIKAMKKTIAIYVDAVNIIHYMHDKYAYEKSQMSLHDTILERLMAFGISGFSVVVDSMSAIKYAKVKPIRNEAGLAINFEIEGDYPKYGNDNDTVDSIAISIVKVFFEELKTHKLYRNAKHTLSILTITSNIVYGKKTGATPDGRLKGEPFAPGANPLHGRDTTGALASLNSVAKIPYQDVCQDGISNTFTIVPNALGKTFEEQNTNLINIIDGYFKQGAHHLNVNVLNKEMLIDAMENPDKYPTLTIRVSGYAVNFNKLNKIQQQEVINRTFHERI